MSNINPARAMKRVALSIPAVKRLWNDRLTLIDERNALSAKLRQSAEFTRRSLFALAFDVQPTPEDQDKLDAIDAHDPKSALRAIIASYDRQSHSTPITVRFQRDDVVEVQRDGFLIVADKYDSAVGAHIANGLDYEPHLETFIRRSVKPGMTTCDIGANIGYVTMLLASIVGVRGRVHAFEPNTENCRLLLLSKKANGFEQIELYPIGLSDKIGSAFFAPQLGSNGCLLPNAAETLMHPNCLVIPTMKLDDMPVGPVHFIKADIEGAEYLALKGAETTIDKSRPIITLEFSMEMTKRVSGIEGHDLLHWIESKGYNLQILRRDGSIGQTSVDSLLADWGDPLRIEDLAFLPN